MSKETCLVFVDEQTKFDELQVPYPVMQRNENAIITDEIAYVKVFRWDIWQTNMNVEHMLWYCRGYPSMEEVGKMYRW